MVSKGPKLLVFLRKAAVGQSRFPVLETFEVKTIALILGARGLVCDL